MRIDFSGYHKRIKNIIEGNERKGSKDNGYRERIWHGCGITGNKTFQKTGHNKEGKGAEKYLYPVFKSHFKGSFSGICTREEYARTKNKAGSTCYYDGKYFHGTVYPYAADTFPQNSFGLEHVLKCPQHNAVLQ